MTSNFPTRPQLSSILLRIAVHAGALLPLAFLAVQALNGDLTANPIQFIEQSLGRAALYLLTAALAVTPLVTVSGWKMPARHRRALGLYAFFYFFLHFFTFAVLDYGLNWGEIGRLTTEKPFIIVGALAGLILCALAATSFRIWMKRLGKRWQILHRSVYFAGILAVLHYAWALKGSLTSLSGDVLGPLMMALLLSLLLILRLPPLRARIVSWRRGLRPLPVAQEIE